VATKLHNKKYLFALLLLSSPQSQGAVFGDGDLANGIEDGRTSAPAHLLEAVGTIFCDEGLRGTGTHIDTGMTANNNQPAIIVTAAHVLFDANTGEPFANCSYRPENKRLRSVPFAQISSHSYQPLISDKLRQSETDIVFVALQRKPYQKGLRLTPPETDTGLLLLGYNGETERIDISADCQIYDSANFKSEYLLLHNCDAESGASGGPLLKAGTDHKDSNSLNEVVAIHGGTLTSAGHAAPGALAQPERWINQARRIDRAMLRRLQEFLAYLGRDSAD
jgi:V8-like Glu-specific endopeptidase